MMDLMAVMIFPSYEPAAIFLEYVKIMNSISNPSAV